MSPLKRLLTSDGLRRTLCALAAAYIWLVHATSRWEVVGGEVPKGFWDTGRPFILAFWHGRILMMPYCWPKGKMIHMLISGHRDGQIIARTIAHFGIDTIVGSSSKGGGNAMRGLLRTLRGGACIGITPDGPRGPAMQASEGVAQIAKLSGVPIIPCAVATSRRRLLASWDRFALAAPFSRGVFVWGKAIDVPDDSTPAAIETLRRAIEESLNAVTREADALMGHEAPLPAAALPS